jgi:polyhydroxyalkanoic acid synthase PhaR subunit
VANETTSQNFLNPWEFWQQWNKMTTSMWTDPLQKSKEAGTTADSFYRSWMNSFDVWQENAQDSAQAPFDPRETWNMWCDATMHIWRQAAEQVSDPLGLINGWMQVMEQVQKGTYAGIPSGQLNPFTLFRDWYNATSEQWSSAVEDVISTERFLQLSSAFLKSSSSLTSAFRRASEEYFKILRLPTISDIANIAQLVIRLEEKLDSIEDVMERYAEQAVQRESIDAKIGRIEHSLQQLEQQLNAAFALGEQSESSNSAGKRSSKRKTDESRVEKKEK